MMKGEFLGGTETFDGITTEWGRGWEKLGQTADLDLNASNVAEITDATDST